MAKPRTTPILSILICSIFDRAEMLNRLLSVLEPQCEDKPVEVVIDTDGGEKAIGKKRNDLLAKATGCYIAFIDDDDLVANCYVDVILDAIGESMPDCVGMKGIYTVDGQNPKLFIHTIKCDEWCEKDGVYWRTPNHLNPVKREFAVKTGFPADSNYGEDHDYSQRLKTYLKTEVMIEEPIYYYLFQNKK